MGGRLLLKRARRRLVPPVQFQIISSADRADDVRSQAARERGHGRKAPDPLGRWPSSAGQRR
jgi:hypothetical protein